MFSAKLFKQHIDMTKGPIFTKMLLFALPLSISIILQMLYNMADLAVVGKFAINPDLSLSAVGVSSTIVNLFLGLFIGLSMGANIIVSRAIGENNATKIQNSIHTSVLLSFILGVFVAIVGYFLATPLLKLINCTGELLNYSSLYLKIIFIGSPFSLVYNFGSSILKAKGDTRRPLVYLTISGLLNVILNLILVIVFRLEVVGVAVATIASQLFSAILVITTLIREEKEYKLSLKKLKLTKEPLLNILGLGIPSGIQSSVFGIANTIAQSFFIAFENTAITAGSTIYFNISNFVLFISTAMLETVVAFTSQNYGAKNYKFIRKIERIAILIGVAASIVLSVVFLLFKDFIIGIYTDSPEIKNVASISMDICFPFFFIWTFAEIAIGLNKGLNSKIPPTIISIVTICVFRVVYFFILFEINKSFTLLMWGWPISWILAGILQYACFLIIYKKTLKNAQA